MSKSKLLLPMDRFVAQPRLTYLQVNTLAARCVTAKAACPGRVFNYPRSAAQMAGLVPAIFVRSQLQYFIQNMKQCRGV